MDPIHKTPHEFGSTGAPGRLGCVKCGLMEEADVHMTAGWSDDAKYSIAIDFDGVIHSYTSKWEAPGVIPDPPVPGAIDWLNAMVKKFTVIIHTTRGKTPEGADAVGEWLIDHGFAGPFLVTAEKRAALIYLDDRAVRFDGSNFPTADQIHRELIPWNKRPMGHKK